MTQPVTQTETRPASGSDARPITGWGLHPTVEARTSRPASPGEAAAALGGHPVLARGLARSYGDSALNEHVISTLGLDDLVDFDPATGTLTCEAGVSLAEVLRVYVPRGWFLPVTPGTKFVTVGGAVASDVHGKNHHGAGSFSDHVVSLQVLLGSGEVVTASRTENADLFRATCGGMGLTGVILGVTFTLLPVRCSSVQERVLRLGSLDEVLEALVRHESSTYSVAWIDCVSRGRRFGRSLLMLGEHADFPGDPEPRSRRDGGPTFPVFAPTWALNRRTVAAFNALYYRKVRKPVTDHLIDYEPFFYPLDGVREWNKVYGRPGFLQYQFVLPTSAGSEPFRQIFDRVTRAGLASPLAVLKTLGEGNENLLSFPRPGLTLALDLPVSQAALGLLDDLDDLVVAAGGRLYLSKDARMSVSTFRSGYPQWEEFEAVREKYGAVGVFSSTQSRRLGLA